MLPEDESYRRPPSWVGRAVSACGIIFVVIALTVDLNGNIVLSESPRVPDLLRPMPLVSMLISLGTGFTVSAARAVRYRRRKVLWVAITAGFIVTAILTILPAL